MSPSRINTQPSTPLLMMVTCPKFISACAIVRGYFALVLIMYAFHSATLPAAAATFNVRDYGAVGDGITDDRAAIQRALDAASASPGSTVFFPSGRYRCSFLRVRDVSLLGQSKQSVTLEGPVCDVSGQRTSMSNLTISGREGGRTGLVNDTSRDSSYTNVAFLGARHVPSMLLNARSLARQTKESCVVENCEFSGFFNHIVGNGCNQIFIRNSSFTNSFGPPIWIERTTNVRAESNTLKLSDSAKFSTGFFLKRCDTTTIYGNRLEDCAGGILCINVNNINVENNTVSRFFRFGIESDSSKGIISNNSIQGLSQNASVGIVMKSLHPMRAINNRVSDCGFGITGLSFDTEVIGNNIERTTQGGIGFTGGRRTCKIDSNVLKDCGLLRPPSNVITIDRGLPGFLPIITNNRYTGGRNNLVYFIRCEIPSPPSVVTGNTTTTMLPTYIKP